MARAAQVFTNKEEIAIGVKQELTKSMTGFGYAIIQVRGADRTHFDLRHSVICFGTQLMTRHGMRHTPVGLWGHADCPWAYLSAMHSSSLTWRFRSKIYEYNCYGTKRCVTREAQKGISYQSGPTRSVMDDTLSWYSGFIQLASP